MKLKEMEKSKLNDDESGSSSDESITLTPE